MTLTVRSASVTGATTAARALTYAEMDANWDHVANFTPSGGTKEPINTALKRLPHSAQYSSAANFNSAQAALTGTTGLYALRIGAGQATVDQIRIPGTSGTAVFSIGVGGGTFSGTYDPTMGWGYNPGREVTTEPQFGQSIEANYNDGSGENKMEVNWSYTSSDGLTSDKRPYGLQINRVTHKFNHQWSGEDGFIFASLINGTPNLAFNANNVGIGIAATTGSRVLIAGTQNSASSEFGVDFQGTAGTTALNTYIAFLSRPSTTAGAVVYARIQHFALITAVKGAGATITEEDGFRCTDLTVATNSYGFKGEVTAGSNKYNLYMDGTAQNYLAGVTGIGVAPSSTTNLILAAGTTGVSSLRIPHGSAPTSPVNGDIWTTTSGLFVRVNGATVGPLT